jgi:hypothetical protein
MPSQDLVDKLGHLFASQGQLQIIETPCDEGAHGCVYLPIPSCLFHSRSKVPARTGFSHDIRTYNCVLCDKGSHLIDIDFGGAAGTLTYPAGYHTLLGDGTRIPETVLAKDRAIQKWHDVYALVKLLLHFHKVIL